MDFMQKRILKNDNLKNFLFTGAYLDMIEFLTQRRLFFKEARHVK